MVWYSVSFPNRDTSTAPVKCAHLWGCPHTVYKGVQGIMSKVALPHRWYRKCKHCAGREAMGGW